MATESNSRPAKRPKKAASSKAPAKAPAKRRAPARKPKMKTRRVRRHFVQEFKPDNNQISPLKMMHFTQYQQYQLLRWGLYIATCVLCLVIQDTIMSRVSIFGSTTDLAVAAMLLITVIEGSEVGSVFILIASCIFYFSGSAPGPYSVGMLSILGLFATLFRQQVWHRSPSSIILCAGLAVIVYELGLYGVGLFLGLTRWYRFFRFVVTGLLTVAAMIPLYYLINRIGQIGGHIWKE